MNIIIRGRNVDVSDSLEAHCREHVRRAVQPFAERVVRVEVVLVSLSRYPMPISQECRTFITLESGERLMFASSDRDHYRAVTRATLGAGRHLARTLDRWRTTAFPRTETVHAY